MIEVQKVNEVSQDHREIKVKEDSQEKREIEDHLDRMAGMELTGRTVSQDLLD